MDKSLRSNTNVWSVTTAAIKQAMRSPAGAGTVWVIVEGEDDFWLYSRMFEDDLVAVRIAQGDDGKNGYKNVEAIVAQITEEDESEKICGIRDRDYTDFESTDHLFPDNIFVTDRRDLEMMLFESQSVISEMHEWTSSFTQVWTMILPVAMYLGYVRICNQANCLGIILRESIKPGKIWDFKKHDFKDSWRQVCSSSLEPSMSADDIDKFIVDSGLSGLSPYDICRGHDVIMLLSLALVKQEFAPDAITKRMINSYTIEDFQRTDLYKRIYAWQTQRNLKILRS